MCEHNFEYVRGRKFEQRSITYACTNQCEFCCLKGSNPYKVASSKLIPAAETKTSDCPIHGTSFPCILLPCLPSHYSCVGLLCPGLDMMEVKQQLPSFAAGYAHSLVSQTFIQRADSQVGTKHLMTLGLPQILTALNKHGSGFSQALVDSAFKLLQRQITLLSQVQHLSASAFILPDLCQFSSNLTRIKYPV